MTPRWVHFTDAAAVDVRDRAQLNPGNRRYRTDKPEGLWISDESDETSWSRWASGEGYSIGSNAFAVTLAADASILTLTTEAEVVDFHRTYSLDERGWSVDWPAVADKWQGVTITPYQWELRLSRISWYYTWDCASGCIWDASAIQSIIPVTAGVSV